MRRRLLIDAVILLAALLWIGLVVLWIAPAAPDPPPTVIVITLEASPTPDGLSIATQTATPYAPFVLETLTTPLPTATSTPEPTATPIPPTATPWPPATMRQRG